MDSYHKDRAYNEFIKMYECYPLEELVDRIALCVRDMEEDSMSSMEMVRMKALSECLQSKYYNIPLCDV